jgi:triacylglycerol esterase/lipase EstA (alpha/beta hydrolase family)
MSTPVLLVHGIWDSGERLEPLARALERSGVGPTRALDLAPNDGSASIEALAEQVASEADALRRETGASRIDLVGFSMGALVARYYLQRLDGRAHTRRFVSISGPHAGTMTAYAMPKAGARQMRPRSALLADLARDEDPWGDVEVHTMWTPMDAMILPARSSQLRGAARDHRVAVPLHGWMITHPRAVGRVAEILTGRRS